MNKDIKDIINELIEIDPDFQAKKEELENILKELIKSKPEFEIDLKFVAELKEKLYAKQQKTSLFFNFFTMKTFKSFSAGVVLTALIIAPMFYYFLNNTQTLPFSKNLQTKTNKTISTANTIEINTLTQGAFGKLTSGQSTQAPNASGRGGGGIALEATSSKMMMPYNPTQYKYIYSGSIVLDEPTITVLRPKIETSQLNTNAILSALNLELIDNQSFQNLAIENLTIKEDREFGYIINIYNDNGTSSISIYKNWEKWPESSSEALKEKDVPADAELIEIANAFATKLKIDLSPYGQPVVNKSYQLYRGIDDSTIYIPDELTVVYPILIKGQEVFDDRGNPFGLSINVDIRNKKASGLYNLTQQKYDSADYAVAPLEKIQAAVERGSQYEFYYDTESSKIVEVKLGEPQKVLTKIWQWDAKTNHNQGLFVPALSFPVLEKPQGEEIFDRSAVVIPLAKDLYEENNNTMPILYKGAEPVIEPATMEIENVVPKG